MAAQAAELYADGKSSWQMEGEIYKKRNISVRYLDQPSKDCYGKKPGDNCSIDTADQYYKGLNVHYSSGVYNHFFYILSTMPGWDVQKAFGVMVQANAHYWEPNTTFSTGAGCVVRAAQDLKYNVEDVKKAFAAVKVEIGNCE
jgi:pseudolysin